MKQVRQFTAADAEFAQRSRRGLKFFLCAWLEESIIGEKGTYPFTMSYTNLQ
jgi:hypothetical protein